MEDKEIIIEKNNDESQAEPPAERERTLGETDPAIADEFYRNVYSRPWYRDMQAGRCRC